MNRRASRGRSLSKVSSFRGEGEKEESRPSDFHGVGVR